MKSPLSLRVLLSLLALALAFGATGAASSRAAEPKVEKETKKAPSTSKKKAASEPAKKSGSDTADAEKRPPLKLAIDRTPINRDAADRVSYAPIVQRTAGSVVYVHSSKTVRGQDLSALFNDPLFRRFFDVPGNQDQDTPSAPNRGNGNNNRRNQQQRRGGSGGGTQRLPDQTQQGLGSGVVITADGYILTNNHVIEGADEVKVSIGESSKRYDAKVIGRDPVADIAVLKIDAGTPLSPATFGDSEQLQVGDVVLAIGNPFGVGQSVSRGIVSALSRGVGFGILEDFIQTDAAINPGNSGGALIDTQGRVVGINTAILSRSGGFNGVGFAIPINLVRNIAEQIVNTGRVERGMLGVGPQELDESLREEFGTEFGVIISAVQEDGPAAKAGLKEGDVITKINDREIRDRRQLFLTVGQLAPGTEVTVSYLRDRKPQTVKVTLMRRPDNENPNEEPTAPKEDVGVLNGVTVGDLTEQLRAEYNVPDNVRGAIITEVDPDSPSARQGLREGDVITQLGGRDVRNAEEAVRLSEEIPGPKVRVQVSRGGQKQFLAIDESRK